MTTATAVAASQVRRVHEAEYRAELWDGTELFYRSWEPVDDAMECVRGGVLLFHRGHEHSGRLGELARHLAERGFRVFAWDQRGHGNSPGERGDAPGFSALVKDAESWARWIVRQHGIGLDELSVVGHSVGAVIAAAWVHDYAPPIRAMVLLTPALRVRLYVPFAWTGLRLLQAVRPRSFVTSYVRPGMLTRDEDMARAYAADPEISRSISVRVLLGLNDTARRLIADAGAIRTPTLMLAASDDWVVSVPAQQAFFSRLGSPDKEMEVCPGFRHALLHDSGREKIIERVGAFLDERAAEPAAGAVVEHRGEPGPVSPATRMGYAVSRAFLKTVGRLSHGVALGWRTGFDSGESLDHVYGNRARGVTSLGRLIDRVYLNSPGWRGIRARKQNLEDLLARAARELHAAGYPVRVLDIASGPGRYVLETIQRLAPIPVTSVLRDRDEAGLAAGRRLVESLGVRGVVHERGDAFDPESIAAVRPRPTIAIASGVYELFADNAMIARSLSGLHAALEDDGMLIYTNQPWHPQLAFIAGVLVNREGKPWVMRCRSQAEMDALVRRAGFEKIAMETDEHGIFTVSLARKAPE